MGKSNNVVSIVGFLVIVVLFVALVRTCMEEPSVSPARLASTLSMMRNDMQEIIRTGGVITDQDDNRKTQIDRVSIYIGIKSDTWTTSLQAAYVGVLLQLGWVQLGTAGGEKTFCKAGALASVATVADKSSAEQRNGYVSMVFSPATVVECGAIGRRE